MNNDILKIIIKDYPEINYIGFKICDHCNGYGSSLKENSDTCTKCGGKGVVL